MEKDILSKCEERFGTKYEISKVKMTLTDEYLIKAIDIYVKNLPEVRAAGEIIDYVCSTYTIQMDLINIIKENE